MFLQELEWLVPQEILKQSNILTQYYLTYFTKLWCFLKNCNNMIYTDLQQYIYLDSASPHFNLHISVCF